MLQERFGKDLVITAGGKLIGTKDINDYSSEIGDSELADDPDLDVDTREYCLFSVCYRYSGQYVLMVQIMYFLLIYGHLTHMTRLSYT